MICAAWPLEADLALVPCAAEDDAELDAYYLAASEILWALSGRQYGTCPITVRPTAAHVSLAPSWLNSTAGAVGVPSIDWGWVASCGCHQDPTRQGLSCSSYPVINLGYGNIESVSQILIDGQVLPPEAYRVDDRCWLVRLDGFGWPCCQDLVSPTTEEGTWSVTAVVGTPPPQIGRFAAARLGCELYKSFAGDTECALPQRVQSITRQGVSMVLLDPFEMLDDGQTGIYEVDLFLKAVNPGGISESATWVSPDQYVKTVRTTWEHSDD